jgi:hypothetical protein
MGARTMSALKKNSELTLKKLDSMQAELEKKLDSTQAEREKELQSLEKKLDLILAEIEKQQSTSQELDKLPLYHKLAGIMADIVSETIREPASTRAYVIRDHIVKASDILRKLEWKVAFRRNGYHGRPPIPPKAA